MRAIMVMYDSLSKDFLSAYKECDTLTPNFTRLLERCIRFDRFYVGSMPCMPARRELQTGRYNFLHRGWGPMEPYDDSMPEILKNNGIYTHLVTDHYHYFEDGGCTYHNRFSSWEFFRGQEADPWKGLVDEPPIPPIGAAQQVRVGMTPEYWRQNWVNRQYLDTTEKMPQSKTFEAGLEFIRTNQKADNWFLQIETFDPHEPFQVHREYLEQYEKEYSGEFMDWPAYVPVDRQRDPVEHVRAEYQALVTMCDEKLGLVLDAMDRYDMWKDTMLIVNTDHGFLLGEHEWWGKNAAPMFNEIACIPFFLYDPRYGHAGTCAQLTQSIDVAPTLLDFFGVPIPGDMQGVPLRKAYVDGETIHDTVLYGQFGGCVNITDGTYTYFRAPRDTSQLYAYTLMPTNMRDMFTVDQFRDARMSDGFSFTKGAKLMKIKASPWEERCSPCDMLFRLDSGPGQNTRILDENVTVELCNKMRLQMKANDAPPEMYQRMGLPEYRQYTHDDLRLERDRMEKGMHTGIPEKKDLTADGRKYLFYVYGTLSPAQQEALAAALERPASGAPIGVREIRQALAVVALQSGDSGLCRRAEDYQFYLALSGNR